MTALFRRQTPAPAGDEPDAEAAPAVDEPAEEAAPAADEPSAEAVPAVAAESIMSDERIPIARLNGDHVVNLTDASRFPFDAHRRELRVNGLSYMHVSEDADGRWVYRNERV